MPIRTFEECLPEINNEINKRKHKWTLNIIAWMDFEDVAQIIRFHLFKKWEQYNQNMPLAPWVNRVISSQIKNLIRNTYGNFKRPCLECAANEGNNLCSIYATQCADCPLFAEWEKKKKAAHDSKLPVSLENHAQEVFSMQGDNLDIDRAARNIHEIMKRVLKPVEWKLYKILYIDEKKEEDAAQLMGYVTSEKNRTPGYKQIRNLKSLIMVKVKKVLRDGEVDI